MKIVYDHKEYGMDLYIDMVVDLPNGDSYGQRYIISRWTFIGVRHLRTVMRKMRRDLISAVKQGSRNEDGVQEGAV